MGKTAVELREEIEQRRDELGRDFEAIGDRVSPGRIVERRTAAVKGRARRVKEAVMGKADDASEATHDKARGARDAASDAAQHATDAVRSAAGEVAEVPHVIREQAEGNPLAAGLVAFGLGLLAASVLPASRRERQFARQVQPQLENAAHQAADSGRGIVEDLRPAVEESATNIKEAAAQAAQHVADQAKGAAQDTAAVAQDAAGQVKAHASSQ